MIAFVHVPKTAGTSFNKALLKCYGDDKILYDFGPVFSTTSKLIKKHTYDEADFWSLKKELDDKGIKVISGHYAAKKYHSLIDVTDYAVFLRDPIQRIYSEYCHRKRRSFDSFDGSFEDYCHTKKHCNVQSRFLEGSLWPAYGFLGITERYNDSLDLFEVMSGFRPENIEVNANKEKPSEGYRLSDSELKLAIYANAKDVQLYRKAFEYFKGRLDCLRSGFPLVNGQVKVSGGGSVGGFAFFSQAEREEEHVEVDVLVNNVFKERCLAKNYRERLHLLGAPKHGYVGFDSNVYVKNGDEVSVRVASTMQHLAYSGDAV